MERYETEEQQVEAIKAFWKNNGTSIILGAVLGLGGLWGWRYYNDVQLENKAQASLAYTEMTTSLSQEDASSNVQAFIQEHGDTGYGALAALIAAQKSVDSDDIDAAEANLKDAINFAKSDAIADLAKIRLARVQASKEDYQTALSTLDAIVNVSFKDQVEEIKGDIYLAQQEFDNARVAYSSALAEDENNRNVSVKLSNLAHAAAQLSGDASEN